jgi:hypothetical protein
MMRGRTIDLTQDRAYTKIQQAELNLWLTDMDMADVSLVMALLVTPWNNGSSGPWLVHLRIRFTPVEWTSLALSVADMLSAYLSHSSSWRYHDLHDDLVRQVLEASDFFHNWPPRKVYDQVRRLPDHRWFPRLSHNWGLEYGERWDRESGELCFEPRTWMKILAASRDLWSTHEFPDNPSP